MSSQQGVQVIDLTTDCLSTANARQNEQHVVSLSDDELDDCYVIESTRPAPLIVQDDSRRQRHDSVSTATVIEEGVLSHESISIFHSNRTIETLPLQPPVDVKEIIILWDNIDQTPRRRVSSHGNRHMTIPQLTSLQKFDELEHPYGFILRPGMTVEMLGGVFLKLEAILHQTTSQDIILAGVVLYKCGEPHSPSAKAFLAFDDGAMPQLLPKHPGEVVMAFNTISTARVPEAKQLWRYFLSTAVTQIRRLVITNRSSAQALSSREQGTLICHWKLYTTYSEASRQASIHRRTRVLAIRAEECGAGLAAPNDVIKNEWRGDTQRGGGCLTFPIVELDRRMEESQQARRLPNPGMQPLPDFISQIPEIIRENDRRRIRLVDGTMNCHLAAAGRGGSCRGDFRTGDSQWQVSDGRRSMAIDSDSVRYSFGDAYCGCGGASCGAVAAGLAPVFAVDADLQACQSYQRNHPAARVACALAEDFALDRQYGYLACDILHVSPPCQCYSPMHVRAGQNDGDNYRAMAGIELIVQKVKPRIVTFENTFGLSHDRHFDYYRWAILQLTKLNYSVEARIVNLADYGVPQTRKRLIIIASCPGEKNPGFPKPTHCRPDLTQRLGLKPWVTAGAAVDDRIPSGHKYHNPSPLSSGQRTGSRSAATRDRPIGTLLTSSAPLCHQPVPVRDPRTGRRTLQFRDYTIAELLLLQTFPLYHDFGPGQTKTVMQRQIGNAVPPAAFKVIYDHIREHLEREDGIRPAAETIVLD